MLTDPLNVKSLSLAAHTAITVLETQSFATVDVAPGKTVRKGLLTVASDPLPATLIISHSVSNENKPAKTDRTLIRFDVLTKDSQGVEMTAYAYLVLGVPRGTVNRSDGSPWAVTDFRLGVLSALLGVTGVSTSAATLDETKIDRVIAGEP